MLPLYQVAPLACGAGYLAFEQIWPFAVGVEDLTNSPTVFRPRHDLHCLKLRQRIPPLGFLFETYDYCPYVV